MKKILILGKNSYLGESLYCWLKKFPQLYIVTIISTREYAWKKEEFSYYDVVVDYAGVAHINNITDSMKDLFYRVNRDLTIEIGEWSKKHGIKQMIYFSSMNVYGDYCNNIKNKEDVNPTSFYGDSKLQGDLGLEALECETFKVAHVRPPFVYGKFCTGNYNKISSIAKKTPIFPNYPNKKSMIFIDNLNEFVRLLIESGEGGVYTPQNKRVVSTTELVKEISRVYGNKIIFTKLFNPLITLGNKLTRKFRRAFADDCYSIELSNHFDWKYDLVDFQESIRKTEQE